MPVVTNLVEAVYVSRAAALDALPPFIPALVPVGDGRRAPASETSAANTPRRVGRGAAEVPFPRERHVPERRSSSRFGSSAGPVCRVQSWIWPATWLGVVVVLISHSSAPSSRTRSRHSSSL